MAKAQKYRFLRFLLSIYTVIGVLLLILGALLILTPLAPTIWYNLNKDAIDEEVSSISEVAKESESQIPQEVKPADKLPPKDLTLTKENMLIIPKIGVNGEIHENEVGKAGLEFGVWRTYGWGTPEDDLVMILAAHRFGYIYWTPEFRKTNSFYNLPNLKNGDEVSVIWNQRKYKYKVYKEETRKKFSDLDADLILYTCQWFNSPIRIFRYLERVN